MNINLNTKQRESLSSFFNNIAVAWFVALFVVPKISREFDVLTVIRFIANIIGTLTISLYFLRKEKYDR